MPLSHSSTLSPASQVFALGGFAVTLCMAHCTTLEQRLWWQYACWVWRRRHCSRCTRAHNLRVRRDTTPHLSLDGHDSCAWLLDEPHPIPMLPHWQPSRARVVRRWVTNIKFGAGVLRGALEDGDEGQRAILVAGCRSGSVHVVDLLSGREVATALSAHWNNACTALTLSDGTHAVATTKRLMQWDGGLTRLLRVAQWNDNGDYPPPDMVEVAGGEVLLMFRHCTSRIMVPTGGSFTAQPLARDHLHHSTRPFRLPDGGLIHVKPPNRLVLSTPHLDQEAVYQSRVGSIVELQPLSRGTFLVTDTCPAHTFVLVTPARGALHQRDARAPLGPDLLRALTCSTPLPDGSMVGALWGCYMGSSCGALLFWRPANTSDVEVALTKRGVASLQVAPSGELLVFHDTDGAAEVWVGPWIPWERRLHAIVAALFPWLD